MIMNWEVILGELHFKAVRGGGPGGQHVNKVASKIILFFDIARSKGLSDIEKKRLYDKLATKLTKQGLLVLGADARRSQHQNKEAVIERLFRLLESALAVPKSRKRTKPTKAAVEKRIKAKKQQAQKKAHRGKPDLE